MEKKKNASESRDAEKLKDKAISPDVIMMSATPIPRTYALTLYGDTDVSSIKTMPKGRSKDVFRSVS